MRRDDFDLAIVAEAKSWIGTPYRHQQSRRGVGCDCLGLVRGIWRAFYGGEPEDAGPYHPYEDRAAEDGSPRERLLIAATRHMALVATDAPLAQGQLLVFRWRSSLAARHLGIALGPKRFIHAYSRVGVIESPLIPSWRRRIAGRFLFPLPPGGGLH